MAFVVRSIEGPFLGAAAMLTGQSQRGKICRMAPSPPSRNGWVVQLEGDILDLKFCATCFPEPPVHIFERDGWFYCEASAFDELPDAKSVCQNARVLLRTVSGIVRMWRSRREPLEVVCVMARYANGTWGSPEAHFELSSRGHASSIYYVDGYERSPALLFMELANSDERVRDALNDFARPSLSMPCLRRIAETIWTEFDPQDQGKAVKRMVAAALTLKEDWDRFINSVNRGPDAAHSRFPNTRRIRVR